MTATLEFWFDFASTYSYPAAMRMEAEAHARGVVVEWRPLLLGPVFGAQGMKDSPFNLYPIKGQYMIRDLQRICAELDLPFVLPTPFPQNSLLCARIATALEGAPRIRFTQAVYSLEFAEGRAISDPLNAAEALRRSGLDTAIVEKAQEESVKMSLRAATDEAMQKGVFGAPSFVTPDGELFWGNDRLEAALDWALKHAK
ncbi:MAG: 2-hydroxychromene-2-carboxylate isomerase [Pseudomonadota bacterium]